MRADKPTFMIYGANGYTGELTARMAAERGLKPILAGRRNAAIQRLASELDLPYRLFTLDDPANVAEAIADVDAVLHCAGPFWRTSKPMADACIHTHTHYLDITGEIEVFEALAARYDEAQAAGVLLLPGAGFDVVPSDCLAAHLHERLPSATHLTLAIEMTGGYSRGTLTTAIEQIGRGNAGMVRRDERLTPVPTGQQTREIDFGQGPKLTMGIPWGDVSTAYHSTGIPNIEVYMAVSPWLVRTTEFTHYAAWLMRHNLTRRLVMKGVRAGQPGPTPAERADGHCTLWGRVEDPRSRQQAEARMTTPDGYTLTAQTSLAMVERVLAGDAPVGFHTPSSAYGADFVLEIDGVNRVDL